MQEYCMDIDNNKRLDKFILETIPGSPYSYIQKIIRLKKVKVNGRKSMPSYRLKKDDKVQIVALNQLEDKKLYNDTNMKTDFTVIYEDDNILLVDKKPGILCDDEDDVKKVTLMKQINNYIKSINSVNKAYLCNRIDYNTRGIVIIAKNIESKIILDEKIRLREIEKKYFCIVSGVMDPLNGVMENQLFKDSKENRVFIENKKIKGSKSAITKYQTLAISGNLSLLECELITGRTHQIRSQLAYIKCPILGDSKYGLNSINKHYRENKQLLCSYKVKFAFKGSNNMLSYLNNKSFQLNHVDFCEKYFLGKMEM